MKSTYIVFKTKKEDRMLGAGVEAVGAGPRIASVSVHADELTRQDAVRMRQDSNVHVAPAMPMRLVAPRDVPGAQAAAGDIAWGVKAVKADTSPFTGADIVVAVLDTGIDAGHAAFAGINIQQKDFTGEGDGDRHGHGTHCAGTIFGRDVEGKRIGIARGVSNVLIGKVLGQQGGGSSDQIMQAILWAVDQGANVISMSLGIDFPGYVKQLEQQGLPTEIATSRALEGYRANTQLFDSLIAFVRSRGSFGTATVVVAAAGNESMRDQNPDFEVAVSPPAVAEGIVSVAALGEGPQGFTVADFSNTGALIAAPGVNILSAKLGGGLRSMSGTSMATPHVAGVTTLWADKLKRSGRLTASELVNRVIASGTQQGLKAGFDPVDVGSGLAIAPQ
jgi:subtilisin family serine protease